MEGAFRTNGLKRRLPLYSIARASLEPTKATTDLLCYATQAIGQVAIATGVSSIEPDARHCHEAERQRISHFPTPATALPGDPLFRASAGSRPLQLPARGERGSESTRMQLSKLGTLS